MELIIGGSFQGKLEYVRQKLKRQGMILEPEHIWDGADLAPGRLLSAADAAGGGPVVLDHLHLLVRTWMQDGDMETMISALESLIGREQPLTIICDEVGYGVVPIEREERQYREAVGRVLCYLAQRADSVERMIGGLPMKIK